ncbi:MAG: 16S rRNA (cytosine(1402)-N(4))-methyltransferase RsmH [Steroidobacteraceae bacterium]
MKGGGRGPLRRLDKHERAHEPVLLDEALALLTIEAGGFYVDATYGRGGHTARILEALGGEGRVLAIDRDPQAVEAGRRRFGADPRFTLLHASYADLAGIAQAHAPGRPCRGVLFDLGVSSPQLDDPSRGFSFRADGPLDMRMDPTRGEPVSAWLARASADEIREVISAYGEERFARRVAQAIVSARGARPIERTGELAALVARAVPTREPGKHPATRTFQALRMHINNELGELEQGLAGAVDALAAGGRLVVVSFHSVEDRVVKRFLKHASSVDPALADLPVVPPSAAPRLKLVGRKTRPGTAESARNPRARSALLRAAEKLP